MEKPLRCETIWDEAGPGFFMSSILITGERQALMWGVLKVHLDLIIFSVSILV